jgi:hypothetical protein
MGFIKKLFGSKQETKAKGAFEPPPGKTMHTLDTSLVVEPFSKVNYWDLPNGGKRVRAYFLMERPIEGAQTGVALDGSGSMMINFGKETIRQARQLTQQEWVTLVQMGLARQAGNQVQINNINDPRTLGALVSFGVLQQTPPGPNIVEQQARDMTAYLSKFDADGGTTVIYWATGDGRQIEVVGDLTGAQCPTATFTGPKAFGNETHLLPAVKYFVERFTDARWGIYTFITDGALNDLDAVKRYCVQLARDVAKNKRNPLKFVLIGVGDDINEGQMEELDDLETGTDVDLWDHKIAKEMKQLAEIFAEVVSETVIIVPGDGVIKDAQGSVVKDCRDTGLPALAWFDLPPGSQWFSLDVGGQTVTQPLAPGVAITTAQPPAPVPPSAATVPCVECREPLPVGTKVCPRCGTPQDLAQKQPAPATPAPTPTATSQPAAPGRLTATPALIDFGAFNNWKSSLPTQELRLRNSGSTSWNGTVRNTLPWLEASPTTVSCPAGGEVVLMVALTPAGGRLKPRVYDAPDALIIEGEGQTLQVGARVDTK